MSDLRKNKIILILVCLFIWVNSSAQKNSLVNTSNSLHSKLSPVDLTDVKWTNGFWAERFEVCKNSMVPHMLDKYLDDTVSHAFANFEIAAGLKEGEHSGPPFHDGDFYKILEGLILVYSATQEESLDRQIDSIIAIIAQTQREDGYIHTPVVIEQLQHPERKKEFDNRLDFETYNMGHLMTAACIHHRVTGKSNLLDIAAKATDFLYEYLQQNEEELAKNAICPSHYMGVTEMYRTTADPRYLELATALIDIRSKVEDGTDHNQDRIPFRQQTKAIGHGVRANYLYAGAADVYLETGDDSLMAALEAIWQDLTEKKLYITGGCGALYDGVSPQGTSYDPSYIQQVHQAYGQDYELPNLTAHNESCANIGNILWNWRMLMATADAKYADIIEMTIYNSLLAGVSLDGKGYFYTNPLAVSQDLPYILRWSREREEYISYCNCCPPNTIRTVAEIHNYVYSISDDGLWINLYGGSSLSTKLLDSELEVRQITDYPWSGDIKVIIDKAPKSEFSIRLRIPGWCDEAEISINSMIEEIPVESGTFASINRKWKKGDIVSLKLKMGTDLIEANPLIEQDRNQVAVRRGPVVYCLESMDIPEENSIFDVVIPTTIQFAPTPEKIGESEIISLNGEAIIPGMDAWQGELYRKVNPAENTKVHIKMVPYYAWGNRGKGDMSVWLPIAR